VSHIRYRERRDVLCSTQSQLFVKTTVLTAQAPRTDTDETGCACARDVYDYTRRASEYRKKKKNIVKPLNVYHAVSSAYRYTFVSTRSAMTMIHHIFSVMLNPFSFHWNGRLCRLSPTVVQTQQYDNNNITVVFRGPRAGGATTGKKCIFTRTRTEV
jgi:hypothetical protein